MFAVWKDRVPREADLVCYWFAKAGEHVAVGKATRVGLVATNSIRGGANRRALQAATAGRPIFDAWSDEPWVIDGAAVRVSLVCFSGTGDAYRPETRMDGEPADEIHSDLTVRRGASGLDLTGATRIPENIGVAFMGDTKGGPFDIPGGLAREWLSLPANPNGRPNADVLKPWVNGMDLTRRPAGKWIVDFRWSMTEADAALYEAPFAHVKEHVRPVRQRNRREAYRLNWWRHVEPRQGMWRSLDGLTRCIATARVAKHRLFVWLDARIVPDSKVIIIARDDDVTFGILHSRFHEAWSLRMCSWHGMGNDPVYNPSTVFQTSPSRTASRPTSPPPTTLAIRAPSPLRMRPVGWWNSETAGSIRLNGWSGWTSRFLAIRCARSPTTRRAAKELKARTLTNLYNARPQWLGRCPRRARCHRGGGLRMGRGGFRGRRAREAADTKPDGIGFRRTDRTVTAEASEWVHRPS